MTAADRRARMALTCVMDGGDPAVAELVVQVGAEAAWAGVREGALGEQAARRAATLSPPEDEWLQHAGVRFVVPGDEEWAAGADDLRFANTIQRRGGEPLGLWLRGPGHLAGLMARSVAVVGSRAATAYGSGVAADLAAEVAEAGVTVVSGGAFGIDAAAHRGALAAGGRTVGVVANGVDVGYPAGNTGLFEVLAREHLIVSELPPGAHPTRVRFLARNRLIAALSRGTVVVEAALRSGARNTAGWALECQRPLMAVPGPVYSAASVAPHLMIRNGQASLVTRGAEVLELIADAGESLLPLAQGPRRVTDDLDPSLLSVFEAVPSRRRAMAGDIALAAGVAVPRCLAALAALDDLGLVEGDERGWLAVPAGHRVRVP
ncbi:MAG: dprA [Friedmanniella sp.]|nr:dprA [Friedmanniella sp.]